MVRKIQGAFGGGGGGGSGSTFTQTPDNLRSEDLFEGLFGLGHGRWKGPVNGMRSIRINDTPLEDQAGKSNFEGWVARFGDGDPTQWPNQRPTLTLGAAAAPVNINTNLANVSGTGTPVVRTVSNTGADAIDLRFVISELFYQNKSGIYNDTLHLKIRMKPTGHTGWIDILVDTTGTTDSNYSAITNGYNENYGIYRYYNESYYDDTTGSRLTAGIVSGQLTITGKTTQPYVKEVRISVPNTGSYSSVSWDIEVTLMEQTDLTSGDNHYKRSVLWESASAVFKDNALGTSVDWIGLAWLHLVGQASSQVSGIPEVWGEYDTKIVSVPPGTVYNPTTRQYTGTVWNGSWIKAFTNDPAWVINDLLEDPVAGVSAMAPGSYLNKWDALELSKHCSTLVDDGKGTSTTHPRFSLNGVWNEPQKADEFIRNMAGAVGAAIWDNGGGEWRCRVDKIENPVAVFTEENIEGEFSYSHTDVDTRYNDITVKFNNEEFEYRPDAVRLFDSADITAHGRKVTVIPAIGCTNRQEALRRGMLRLRASINEYRIVSFVTNRQGRFLEPLSTILVADKSLGYTAPAGSTALANTDARDHTTGRILSLDAPRTTITLRDPLRLEPGATYNIRATAPNAGYNPGATTEPAADWDKPTLAITRAVASGSPRGDVTTIVLTSALPADIPPNAPIALEATGLPSNPKTYRIIAIDPQEDDESGERVAITAIEVDTGKYAAADTVSPTAYAVDQAPPTPPKPIAPPSGVLHLKTFDSNFGKQAVLEVDWYRPTGKFIKGFIVRYQQNDGPTISLPLTTQRRIEIADPTFGTYDVDIVTVDIFDKESQPLSASLVVTEQGLAGSPGDQNRIRFTRWEQDYLGWIMTGSAGPPTFVAKGIARPPLVEIDQASLGVIFTGASQNAFISPSGVPVGGTKDYDIPVTPGERIYVGAELQPQTMPAAGRTYLWVTFWNAAGAVVGSGSTAGPIINGSVVNWTPRGDFFNVPSTAATVTVQAVFDNLGSGATTTGGQSTLNVRKFIVCSAGTAQVTAPPWVPGPSTEPGAQVTRWIPDPTQRLNFKYNSTGTTADPGEFNRDITFKLMSAAGAYASGVTFRFKITTGGMNGLTSLSGDQTMSVSSGVGTVTVTSLESSTCQILITAMYQGQDVATKAVDLTKELAVGPITGGGGGGGGGGGFVTMVSTTSMVSPLSGSTPQACTGSGALNATTPASFSSVKIQVNISADPGHIGNGSATCTFQVQRWNGSSWVNVGSALTGSSIWRTTPPGEEEYTPGEGIGEVADTGVVASTAYQWRVAFSESSGGKLHYLSGAVAVVYYP